MAQGPNGKKRRERTGSEASPSLVGQLVAAYKKWGGTQAELATAMGTSTAAVSRLLTGRSVNPQWRTIESFARAVGRRVQLRLVR